MNEALSRIAGFDSPEEMMSRNVVSLYKNPADREVFIETLKKEGSVAGFEVEALTKTGKTKNLLLSAVLEGEVLSGMIIDITEHKLLEEELLQAQRMESIGLLAGGIAHDFNNLLTAIKGYAELTMLKMDKADPLYENLMYINNASALSADLVRQLLLFSRKEPMEFTVFDLNRIIENMSKILHRLIGEDVTLNIELEPDLWIIKADKGNIEQVIMNLVVNARDAMSEGGKITIKTENVEIDKDYCKTYPYAHPGRFISLSIIDTGQGMDEDTLNRIFEPFFTTKGIGRGTGLGLSVVYGIVKQHEGWINVQSKPGEGSVFSVYLPASSIKAEDKYEDEDEGLLQGFKGDGERILLVEDEEGVRKFAVRVLRENNYTVFEAKDAKKALAIFEREKGEFHMVFSDVVLPDKDGLQLIDQFLSLQPGIKVLLSSGYTDEKSQMPIIRERGFRFLQKPYAISDLLRTVREVIESG